MMRTRLSFAFFISLFVLIGCKKYTPFFPTDRYEGLQYSLTHGKEALNIGTDSAYVLYVYEYDTVIGRQHFPIYKSTPTYYGTVGRAVDSVFLYFIDQYRFYYTRKVPRKGIELTGKYSSKHRIGWYFLAQREDEVLVVLYSSKGKVDDQNAFSYSQLELTLTSNGNTLILNRALYPLYIRSREEILKSIPKPPTEFLQASNMGYHAEWVLKKKSMQTLWNEMRFDSVSYNWELDKRSYFFKDSIVGEEYLTPSKRQSF